MRNPFKIPNTPYALPLYSTKGSLGNPNGDMGWDEWKAQAKKKYPVRYWLHYKFLRFFRIARQKYITDSIYWLKCHTWKKYHLIDIRNPENDYDWGYIDIDNAILYANMALLVQFVEKELLPDLRNWENEDKRKLISRELINMYNWWKYLRKLEAKKLEKANFTDYTRIEKEIELKDNQVLTRMIQLRKYMWT